LTVTYHDSCHLARGMGVTKQPRKILQSIPGIKFVEMREADQCCGAAGLFQGLYPEIATKITTNKINNVKKTGADIVAVECPACLHRIQGGINFHKTGQKAVHLVEILDAAYQKVDSLKLAR
jgi:glycolate oxidase iron-sulfur subunit